MKTIESLKKLEENPLFQMSLGSKELFHSNFLAWIIGDKEQEKFVIGFLNDLLKLDEIIKSIVDFPEREKMNIDLRFKVELLNGKQHLIIIENKVKSLPYLKQLEDYKEKIEKENKKNKYGISYFLLSLIEPEFKDELESINWILIDYEDIANAIKKNIEKVNKNQSSLIPLEYTLKAYNDFVVQLQEIATKDLKINDSENELFDYFNSETRKQYQSLRLHDLYLKSKYQQVANAIKTSLSKNFGSDIDVSFNPWEMLGKNNKVLPKKENGVFIKEGFSNSNGMIDFKYIPHTFKIYDTDIYYTFCIQLQGDQLRYALEFMGKVDGEAKKEATRLIYKVAHKLSESQEWLELPSSVEIDKTVFVTHKILGKPKKASEFDKERIFCKFGDTFLYKYHHISPKTKVQSIIDLYAEIFTHLFENKQYYIDVLNESLKTLNNEVSN